MLFGFNFWRLDSLRGIFSFWECCQRIVLWSQTSSWTLYPPANNPTIHTKITDWPSHTLNYSFRSWHPTAQDPSLPSIVLSFPCFYSSQHYKSSAYWSIDHSEFIVWNRMLIAGFLCIWVEKGSFAFTVEFGSAVIDCWCNAQTFFSRLCRWSFLGTLKDFWWREVQYEWRL